MKLKKNNDMALLLLVLKSPEKDYNARNLAELIKISAMGALKIAKKLEEAEILKSKKVGQANIYSINFESEYARQYLKLLLKKEAQSSSPYVKRWIRELEKVKGVESVVLYGSVLKKEKEARDIDVLIIVNQKSFDKVKKSVEEINLINEKKIHPMYQSKEDLKKHIKEENKVVLNAIKGIVVSGEDAIIETLEK